MNTEQNVLQKIKKLEEELQLKHKELNDLRELNSGINSGKLEAFATLLHDKFCHHDHANSCGWYYETWESPRPHDRQRYLIKARALLAFANKHGILPNELVNLIQIL